MNQLAQDTQPLSFQIAQALDVSPTAVRITYSLLRKVERVSVHVAQEPTKAQWALTTSLGARQQSLGDWPLSLRNGSN